MKKLVLSLRQKNVIHKYVAWFVLLNALLGIFLQLIRAFLYEEKAAALATTFVYFTTQSNLLIAITSSLFLLGFSQKKWFFNLSFITLVNISITGIIFHLLLTPYMAKVDILQHILHTSNPIFYILFFFIFIPQILPPKSFWIGLIYPLVYMVFVYIFFEPVLGNLLEIASPNFESARYVYPFLDPSQYDSGYAGLLLFNLGLIAPIILIYTFLLTLLKRKFELKIAS